MRSSVYKRKRKNTASEGAAYEKHCEAKMRWRGWLSVQRIGKSGDYGADIIAKSWFFQKIVVQCKHYRGKVGVKAVQEVAAARIYYSANRAAVATNSTFTKQAVKLAQKCGVELWERF